MRFWRWMGRSEGVSSQESGIRMPDSNTSTIRDVLSEALRPIGGGEQVTSLTEQLRQLQTISQAAVESTKENTKADETSTAGKGSSGGAGAETGEGDRRR